jgi:hypothetical protein
MARLFPDICPSIVKKAVSPLWLVVLLGSLAAWLWPIGIGGQMPAGGDVTRFFLGLMGFLTQELQAGRLPVWNDLWGYGFPAVGESQMGVFYPPHLFLYGLLPTETAYVVSLVLHTVLAGLGGWWLARQLGLSDRAAALAGLSWSASGFFVIHLPHPWAYTTGCWMPWAWGLGWGILTRDRLSPATWMAALSLVLVLQVLPGHFQLAFQTQVVLLLMAAWRSIDRSVVQIDRKGKGRVGWAPPRATATRRALAVALCVGAVFPLAALQIWPTARLAGLAASQRDFEYLSGFAATPFHLVGWVAPRWFHTSPIWRPLVWDPFHTSPEENLTYVGLVPLFLAILVIRREWLRDPVVRVLSITAAVSLVLSLGPYAPGFRWLIELPGFSFFRAPARWGATLSLAIALLAGKGVDAWNHWSVRQRSFVPLVWMSLAWIVLLLGIIELALWSGLTRNAPLSQAFQKLLDLRPWSDGLEFRELIVQARRTPLEPAGSLPTSAAKNPGTDDRPGARSFVEQRWHIHLGELGISLALMGSVLLIAGLDRIRPWNRRVPELLLLLAVVDLIMLSRLRPLQLAPLRPLVEQSPVLATLSRSPRGTRILDGSRNLPMLVGLNPVAAYRTLDLPVMVSLTSLASAPLWEERLRTPVRQAMRAVGVGVRVLDPTELTREESRNRHTDETPTIEIVSDPGLASWLSGPQGSGPQEDRSTRFGIMAADRPPPRAWFVPLTAGSPTDILDSEGGSPWRVLELFDAAIPLESHSESPSSLRIEVDVNQQGWVLITQLADPLWEASWEERGGENVTQLEILPAFRSGRGGGAWQRVLVSHAGPGTLHLQYRARDVERGAWVSLVSGLGWGVFLTILARSRNRAVEPGTLANTTRQASD